jgi:arylsulfatase A-like enzyme
MQRVTPFTVLGLALTIAATTVAAQEQLDRTVLPIAEPTRPTYRELDARKAKPPARFEVKAPAGAPNVVIVLIDDIGFGGPSTFGGPIRTPTMDQLAESGLRFNNFHTTALCSPTRNALKTGRNHHTTNTGSIMETATAFPGNTGQVPNSVAPLAEMLRLNGYSTGAFGKWHETAAWETSVSGPFDRWPTHQGFDKFYGFIGGETDQWYPLIYDGVIKVDPPKMPDYHFTVDMTNQAINWVKAQQSMTPDKPFFVYYATGSSHAPHQVTPEWSTKYKGHFDTGWDTLRVETFERQKRLGVIPQDTVLTPRDPAFPAWDSLAPDVKALAARQMEVFAGYQEETDHEIGRVVDAIEALGRKDNTVIVYIFGDNGASMEGTETGTFNEMVVLNGIPLTQDQQLQAIKAYGGLSVWGGPRVEPHYAAAWAWAGNTPFQWGKQVASHLGGTRNPMVVRWPGRIADKGGLRNQFLHLTDIAPTLFEAAGVPAPRTVDGTEQMPLHGASFMPSFTDAAAPSRHGLQYFEVLGNRAMYKDGWWLACRIPRIPWKVDMETLARFAPGRWDPDADPCELYDLKTDFSQAHDLAAANPAKVAELRALFWEEAARFQVLPLLGSIAIAYGEEFQKPEAKTLRFTYRPGVENLSPGVIPQIYNRSFAIEAEIRVARNECLLLVCSGAEGVIVAEGDFLGGFSLYVMHGKPRFTYSFLGLKIDTVDGTERLPVGPVTLRFEFKADKPGEKATGGVGRLLIDGREVGTGRIEHTVPGQFTSYAGLDIGRDNGLPVVPELLYAFERPFPTQTEIVTVDFELN